MPLTLHHLSVWEVGHRWHNEDPNLTDPQKLPLPVQDTLRMLTEALTQDGLHSCSEGGHFYKNHSDLPSRWEYIPQKLLKVTEEVLEEKDGQKKVRIKLERMTPEEAGVGEGEIDEDEEYYQYVTNQTRRHREFVEGLDLCHEKRVYDKAKLESVFLGRYDLFKYCHTHDIELPSFWYGGREINSFKQSLARESDAEFVIEGQQSEQKLRPNQINRLLCRAVAQTLWDLHPDMNITEMCKHKAIKQYGNGAPYLEKTVRSWISDLDPRPEEQKRGRPPKKLT